MKSIWEQSIRFTAFEPLGEDIETEVAIIGGGIAGLLSAYMLKERGVDAVVLEADTVCSGQTGRTTAKITAQHGLIYDKLTGRFGREGALEYARANQAAVEAYAAIVEKHQIDCSFERLPAYVYSTLEKDALEKEAKAAQDLGLPATYTTDTRLPFPVAGAVRFDDQAQFHPLRFLQALLPHITVYEHTPVKEVEGNTIRTERANVRAEKLIFACHFPFLNAPGYYFLRMHQERSYVIALDGAAALNGMYIGMDEDALSLRTYGDLLLLGGGGHRTGHNREGGKYDSLRAAKERYYKGSVERAHWSAQDCMPHDGVPYIGRFSHDTPDWYVATGFGKWGMSTSMVAAKLLTEAIAGKTQDVFGVFSPARYIPVAAAPQFLKDSAEAAKGLLKQVFHIPQSTVDELPLSHGGVVEVDGEKLGVYKNERRETHCIHTKCPHLGCELAYNPDEQSWDCPCHGSRFSCTGERLDGPAQEDAVRA